MVSVCGSLAWQALGARSGGDHAGLRGGSLGERSHGGAEERAQGLEIPQPVKQQLAGLWGGAWHAVPAILLVYHPVEKPSTS
jgi:hypothetical protein